MIKQITNTAFFIMALVVIFFAITGDHGLLHLLKINNEVNILQEQNRKLESEIVGLKNQLHAVQHSDQVLEKMARQELGFFRPGETVYIFPENTDVKN